MYKRQQRPLFLQQERRLTAAERGTAMHLVMQYLELGGPDPEEQVRQLTERDVYKRQEPRQPGAGPDRRSGGVYAGRRRKAADHAAGAAGAAQPAEGVRCV